MNWIKALIQRLMREQFYGQLTIHFEAGKVIRAVKTQSLKPE